MSITEQVDVAIVGSGPAGLAAAIELRRQGVARVCVLERDGEAGGIPRHCAHPPFGLREHGRLLTGPAYALRNVEQAERAGVDIRLRHSVVALAAAGLLQLATPKARAVCARHACCWPPAHARRRARHACWAATGHWA